MDKFKLYISAAIRNRFWILCGVVVVLGLGSWYVASASLRESTRKGRKAIEDAYADLEKLNKEGIKYPNTAPIHPNAKTNEETGKIIETLEKKVLDAWEKQYGYQGDEIFVWPAELAQNSRFFNAVKGLRPIESVPLNYEINVDFRGAYRDYIKKELPRLAEIIGARWDPGASTGGNQRGGGVFGGGNGGVGSFGGVGGGGNSESEAETEIDKSTVDWSKANQAYFQNVRLNWNHMPDEAPNTLQMLYAQEDLWVLQAVLTIIKKTNGDADSYHNAAIRKIESIYLGKDAVAGTSSITRIGGGAAPAGNSSGGPGGMQPGGGGLGKGGGGPGGQPGIGGGAGPGGQPGIGGGAGPGGQPGVGGGAGPGGQPGIGGGAGPGGQPGIGGGAGPGGQPGIGGGAGPGGQPGVGGGAGPGGQPGIGGGAGGIMGPGGGQSSGSGSPAANPNDPAEGRYVDNNYVALSAADLRGAASSKLPAKAYLAVAKRMPIRLSLVMDQNKLNTFLVECGNSPLTVEVRQVRFNRATSGAAAGGGNSGSSRGGFGSGGSGGVGGGFGGQGLGGNSNSGKGDGGNAQLNPHPWDRPIEIYAIVYIYNPVDPEKLKLKEGAGASAVASAPPAAPSGNAGGTPSQPGVAGPGAGGPGAGGPGAGGPGAGGPGAGGPGAGGPGAGGPGAGGGAAGAGGNKLRRGEEPPDNF